MSKLLNTFSILGLSLGEKRSPVLSLPGKQKGLRSIKLPLLKKHNSIVAHSKVKYAVSGQLINFATKEKPAQLKGSTQRTEMTEGRIYYADATKAFFCGVVY